MEERTLRCPNCGANATNHDNCEYCGSLLVRFVEKGINLSQTPYQDNGKVFPGLINELKQNLALQRQGNEAVATDIYRAPGKGIGDGYLACVLRTGKSIWHDNQDIRLSNSDKGMVIVMDFSPYVDASDPEAAETNKQIENRFERFKKLPSFELFTSHFCYLTDSDGNKRKGRQYAIDFGEDAEGAARLLSEILTKVEEVSLDENVEYYTNYGVKAVKKSRKDVEVARGCDQSCPTWVYWVGAIILFALFKMCS